MRTKSRWLATLAGWLAGVALGVSAGQFAPPGQGPPPFRRDRTPLNVEAMAGLSKQLVTLTDALAGQTPAERRTAAQMLALATALDPANEDAHERIAAYQQGRNQQMPDAAQVAKSHARIWQVIGWLETPAAGGDGNALAACLKDVLVVSDPKHLRAEALRKAGESGAWSGWVPDVHAYEPPVIVVKDEVEPPPPVVKPAAPEPVLLPKAAVHTVLWKLTMKGGKAEWSCAPGMLQMTAARTSEEANAPLSIVIGYGQAETGGAAPLSSDLIQKLLEKEHGALIRDGGIQITIRDPGNAPPKADRQTVNAAAAVLASAAITGLDPEAIVIGDIDRTGAYKIPSRFWDQLQSLGSGKGRRLVLPAAADAWLPSILAMENPGFFFEYEVLLARDFKQLLDFSSKTPSDAVAAGGAKFREIRERAGSQDLRLYLANRFVRQRLSELAQALPFHTSAAMLLSQASGMRPTLISRAVLAAEISRAIQPMAWIVDPNTFEFTFETIPMISESYELCRSKVERLETYVDRTDKDLFERARALVIALRNFDRAARSRGDYDTMHAAQVEFYRLYREFSAGLANESAKSVASP
ncbi:MAG: hypothetical protein Q8Q59_13440 [Luteolibacter sp.]|jgi:hypothetical protein|nr:hypothetical protein [Luteolibacter sp.]